MLLVVVVISVKSARHAEAHSRLTRPLSALQATKIDFDDVSVDFCARRSNCYVLGCFLRNANVVGGFGSCHESAKSANET